MDSEVSDVLLMIIYCRVKAVVLDWSMDPEQILYTDISVT